MTEKFQFFLNERYFFENTMDLNRIQKYDYYLPGFQEINQFQQN